MLLRNIRLLVVTILKPKHMYASHINALRQENHILHFEPSNPVLWRADMCLSYKYGMNNNWLITLIPSERKTRGSWCALKTARAVPINCYTARSAERFDLYFAYKYSTLCLDSSYIGLDKVLGNDRRRNGPHPAVKFGACGYGYHSGTLLKRVPKIAKKREIIFWPCLFVRSQWNMSAPSGRIFMKFDI